MFSDEVPQWLGELASTPINKYSKKKKKDVTSVLSTAKFSASKNSFADGGLRKSSSVGVSPCTTDVLLRNYKGHEHAISISKIHEVTILVRDLRPAIKFYRDILGLRIAQEAHHHHHKSILMITSASTTTEDQNPASTPGLEDNTASSQTSEFSAMQTRSVTGTSDSPLTSPTRVQTHIPLISLRENSSTCLRLVLAQTKLQWEAVGKQAPGLNVLSLETSTILRDYEQLTSAGVKFLVPPRKHDWGYETSFLDLHGNQIGLFQHTSSGD